MTSGDERRNEILRFLLSFGPDQWAPSVREIGEAVGLAPASVHHHLNVLARDGWIERGSKPRQIRVRREAMA